MKPVLFLPLLLVPSIPALQGALSGPAAQSPRPALAPDASLAWGDVDGDGLDDVLVIDAGARARLLMCFGAGRFEDVTAACGLGEQPRATCALLADLDGDGRDDLYLGSGETRVWRNLGNGTFEPLASGIEHDLVDLAVEAVDRDGDGRADLEIHTEAGDLVYRNLGAGRFELLELPQTLSRGQSASTAPIVVTEAENEEGATGTPAEGRLERWLQGRAAGRFASVATTAPSGSSSLSAPLPFLATCQPGVRDAVGGACIGASSVPQLGKLYPLSPDLFVDATTGNVGMGTTTPSSPLTVLTTGAGSYGLLHRGDSVGVEVGTYVNPAGGWLGTRTTHDLHLFVDDGSAALTIKTDNNVGIRTTSPLAELGYPLSLYGGLHLKDPRDGAGAGAVAVVDGDFLARLNLRARGNSSGAQHFVLQNKQDQVQFQWQEDNLAPRMSIMNMDINGNVGIGTTSPAFKLEVNGTAGKPGGGSWSVSSDARLKKNVHDLEGALETLLALRGVTFEYKDPEAIHELPGERIGFIAQEVEEVLPDWVSEVGGYKRLTVRGFEALAVEALRELATSNEAKDVRISELAQRNDELVGRLESLESQLAGLRAAVATLAENR